MVYSWDWKLCLWTFKVIYFNDSQSLKWSKQFNRRAMFFDCSFERILEEWRNKIVSFFKMKKQRLEKHRKQRKHKFTLCDFKQHCDWRKTLLPSSPFSMTSKMVQQSSAVKVTFLIVRALSTSSEDRMLGETCRKYNKQMHAHWGQQQND